MLIVSWKPKPVSRKLIVMLLNITVLCNCCNSYSNQGRSMVV